MYGRHSACSRRIKKAPFFSIVAADSRNRLTGRFIERIGFYNPMAPEGVEGLRIASDRLEYWKTNGAQLSETVARLVKQHSKKSVQAAA